MKTKLLFLCSANMDRSPAAEALFEDSEKFIAKSAGLLPLARVPVTSQAINWADIIFVMDETNEEHKSILLRKFPEARNKDVRVLGISNQFSRYDPELERLLKVRLEKECVEID